MEFVRECSTMDNFSVLSKNLFSNSPLMIKLQSFLPITDLLFVPILDCLMTV